MNCISSSIEFPPLRSHLKPNRRQPQQNSPPKKNLHIFRHIYISPQTYRFDSLKVNAIPSSLILGNSTIPPSQSGDVSVLLQTGGVLLIAYLIANFILPEFIMKSYRSDESDGKAAAEDEESSEGRKKQGFSGRRR
ncbi:uncharacterized protein LOC120085329 [Benincasa hispida]|uniref:uncharacterized protein LOC120085329 n=1 Tax=Benincasa hispida TaxID=102211 RepID=UPI0018FFA1CD|nr:uncharacterized protein LOC120085329 [Benincasa hispida]